MKEKVFCKNCRYLVCEKEEIAPNYDIDIYKCRINTEDEFSFYEKKVKMKNCGDINEKNDCDMFRQK